MHVLVSSPVYPLTERVCIPFVISRAFISVI